ncbi:DUF2735 domain-containing protein [Methylobacterium oryzisoli]|uniref:DUF2735 domain-containing protein n=1 Tax=Methylobacterium oryzisoli TaxID=3385502 RepID=UPI0038928E1E
MATSSRPRSAKIYQFPAGGRAGAASVGAEARAAGEPSGPRLPPIVYGSGWYHDAAIQDAERARKP